MPERKVDSKLLADMVILRAVGFSNQEIANKLGISVSTVEYHFRKLKNEAKRSKPHLILARVIIEAGPDYLFRLTPFQYSPEELVSKIGIKRGEK